MFFLLVSLSGSRVRFHRNYCLILYESTYRVTKIEMYTSRPAIRLQTQYANIYLSTSIIIRNMLLISYM